MWDLTFSWKKRCQFKCAENDFDISAFSGIMAKLSQELSQELWQNY